MIGEKNTDDVRIKEVHVVLPPVAIREKYPLTEKAADTVINARKEIQNIMDDRDDRLVVVTGPCSIHDPKSAIEYANRLAVLREKYKDKIEILIGFESEYYPDVFGDMVKNALKLGGEYLILGAHYLEKTNSHHTILPTYSENQQ